MRSDSEIFRDNVKKICEKTKQRSTKVDALAGYHKGNAYAMAQRNAGVTTMHIKRYAKALGVKTDVLMEGIFSDKD